MLRVARDRLPRRIIKTIEIEAGKNDGTFVEGGDGFHQTRCCRDGSGYACNNDRVGWWIERKPSLQLVELRIAASHGRRETVLFQISGPELGHDPKEGQRRLPMACKVFRHQLGKVACVSFIRLQGVQKARELRSEPGRLGK